MKNYLKNQLEISNVPYNNEKIEKIIKFHKILCLWNEKYNLTNITDDIEATDKHYIDSLSPLMNTKLDLSNRNIIDVGTGAGFPGLPLAIFLENSKFTLLDSLNKRISFLNEVILQLELKNVKTVHARSEDAANLKEYREKYDVSVARAVAPLNVLSEYLIPFVKVGGISICYKSKLPDDELIQANKAIEILGGGEVFKFPYKINNREWTRELIIIPKILKTQKEYPRKAGTAKKIPIR